MWGVHNVVYIYRYNVVIYDFCLMLQNSVIVYIILYMRIMQT